MFTLPDNARVTRPAFRRRRLDNGLTVLVVEDERVPAISLSLMVRGGACTDPEAAAGLASLGAQLLNKGSRRRDADALAEAVDDLGATYGARTHRDSTLVSLAGLAEDFDDLLSLLAEITLEPVFPRQEFLTLRQRRLHALTRSLDDPSTLADWAFARRLFDAHPYALPMAGTRTSVASIEADAMASWHARHFVPQQAWLAVAGAAPSGKVLSAVDKAFSSWRGEASPAVDLRPPTPAGNRLLVVDKPDAQQAQIRWGHLGINRQDPRHDAADLVNDILGGGGFSSRLMKVIRSEKGLTYGVHSAFDARLHPGPFLVSTFTPTASVNEVVQDIRQLVTQFSQQGPSEAELDEARRRLVGGYALQFETATQVAGQLLEIELYGLAEDSLETYQDRMLTLPHPQACQLAAELLQPERALTVVVGQADALPAWKCDFTQAETVSAEALF